MSDHSDHSKSRTPTSELGDSTETLVETTTTSLPVTFSNPDLLKSEKLLLDLTSTFYCAQLQETNNLFKNVNQTNRGVDKVLTSTIHSLITNLLNQTIVRTNMLVNDENA